MELYDSLAFFAPYSSSESSRSGPRMKLGIMGRKKRNHEEDDPSALAKLLPQNARSSSSSVDGDGVFGRKFIDFHLLVTAFTCF